MIVEARVDAPSREPANDAVLVALFSTAAVPPAPPGDHAKRRRGRNDDKAKAHKRER